MMRSKMKSIIGLALLFIFGLISGIAITLIVEGGLMKQALANPDRGRLIVGKRLSRQLRLEPEQQLQVDEILAKAQDELQAVREEVAPVIDVILNEAEDDIEQVLTPEQREQFGEMSGAFKCARERFGNMQRKRHRHRNMGQGFGRNGYGWQDQEQEPDQEEEIDEDE